MLDMDSRLRAARGIGKDETQASVEVFQTLKRRGHPAGPPPTISDGWGGIDQAMVQVYGLVPAYSGRGRPPTRQQPQPGWQSLQLVKQRNQQGKLQGVTLRVIFGSKAEVYELLGKSTAYVERSHLTSRLFTARQARRSPLPRPLRTIGRQQVGKTPTILSSVPTRACACLCMIPGRRNGNLGRLLWLRS
jgi:hypothetical protein